MGARILGNNVELFLFSQALATPIPLGEIDSFSARSQTSIIKSRPIGYVNEKATLKHGGWDLSFEAGRVNWGLAHFYNIQETDLRGRGQPPAFFIIETVKHYNGAIEQYTYKNVTLFGLDLSNTFEDVKEKISGFASYREQGPVDTTIIADPNNAIRLAIYHASKTVEGFND